MKFEYVYVQAHYFAAGEHPWTVSEFLERAHDETEGEVDTDDIVMVINGRRYVAGYYRPWWVDDLPYVWAGDPRALDSAFRLKEPAWRFWPEPLTIGPLDRETLIGKQIDDEGHEETFARHLDDLVAVATEAAAGGASVGFLTRWGVEAGREPNTVNGPGESYANWWLQEMLPLPPREVTP